MAAFPRHMTRTVWRLVKGEEARTGSQGAELIRPGATGARPRDDRHFGYGGAPPQGRRGACCCRGLAGAAIRGDGESVPHAPILTNGRFSYLLLPGLRDSETVDWGDVPPVGSCVARGRRPAAVGYPRGSEVDRGKIVGQEQTGTTGGALRDIR